MSDASLPLFSGYPGFLPGVAVSLALSAFACVPVTRALGIRRLHAFGLLMSVGLILAATLFPGVLSRSAVGVAIIRSGWSCDLQRIGPASLSELLELHETSANVLLFIPLGFVVAMLPRGHRTWAVALAFAFPVTIEAIQMLAPSLGRACQSADVADNVTGLIVGLAMGLLAGRLLARSKPS